jgi:hypothetical protein
MATGFGLFKPHPTIYASPDGWLRTISLRAVSGTIRQ